MCDEIMKLICEELGELKNMCITEEDKKNSETYELKHGILNCGVIHNKLKFGIHIPICPKVSKVTITIIDGKSGKDDCDIDKIIEWISNVLNGDDKVVLDMKVVDGIICMDLEHHTGKIFIEGDNIKVKIRDTECEFNLNDDRASYYRILKTILDYRSHLVATVVEKIDYLERNKERIYDCIEFYKGRYVNFTMCDSNENKFSIVEFRKIKDGAIGVIDVISHHRLIVEEYDKDYDKIMYKHIAMLIPKGLYERLEEIINKGICDIGMVKKWIKKAVKDIENVEVNMKGINGKLVLKIKYPTSRSTGEMEICNSKIKFRYGTKECEFNLVDYPDDYLAIVNIVNKIVCEYIPKCPQQGDKNV